VRVNPSLKGRAREYSGFFVFATIIASLVWLVHSSAANSHPSANQVSPGVSRAALPAQRPQPTPRNCSACGAEGLQTIYAPLIGLPESSGTEINLNCRSSHIVDVTPTFYTQRGEAYVGNAFQMQPTEVKTVDLKTLVPRLLRERRDLGGMSLSYTGSMLEMWGQLRLMKVNHGGSVDVTFTILQDKRSDVRNAVWYMPEHAEAIIALGNLGSSKISALVKFSNGDDEEVEVPAHGTRLIRRRSEKSRGRTNGEGEAVTIEAEGADGNLITAGAVTAMDGGFTSSIRFYDTQRVAQPNLYATNFRLKRVKPRMLLRNTGTETIAAIPRFLPVSGEPTNFVDLPSVSLRPNEIADVDLEPLQGAFFGRSDFDKVSIQVLNTGSPGSLIGSLNGQDTTNRVTYDVPLRDIGAIRNSTGSYPWRLDDDLSTVVSISNIAPMQSEVVVQINYPGGPYLLNPRRLAAGETAIFDLKKIRDQRIPDRNGQTIPPSVTSGQFKWFIHGAGSGRLIGRAEMLSLSEGVSSSYSCPSSPCPAFLSAAFLEDDNLFLEPGEPATVYVTEIDCDEFGCIGPFSANVTSWTYYDPGFAVAFVSNYSEAYVAGLNGGTASYTATIGYNQWSYDGQECRFDFVNYTDTQGQARVLKMDSISPGRGVVSATTHVTITGKNFASGASILAGSGITASNINVVSSEEIQADLAIEHNASGGNRSVKVKVNGKTSNGKDFYVQIPSKLVPLNSNFTPNGIGPLHTPNNSPLQTIDGANYPAPLDHICGVFRYYLFYLGDQANPAQPILNRPFTVGEIFSDYSGSFAAPTFTPMIIPANANIADLMSLFFPGTDCLQTGENQTFDQKFTITFNGHDYFPTTKIHITRGNFNGTLSVDRTITTP
jgi:hypothetical protein